MGKTRRELSWFGARKGWKKYIGGKVYYFNLGGCKSPTDQEGYRQALTEYLALRQRLDQQQAKATEQAYTTLPNGASVEGTLAYLDWGAFAGTETTPETRQKHKTIAGLVNVYLENRKTLAESGQIEVKTYAVEKHRLASFLSFCNYNGKTALAEALTPDFLGQYKSTLLKAASAGKVSGSTVQGLLRVVKACLQWGYDEELIEKLPRKTRDYARVKVDAPKPEFFTPDEFRLLYQAANPRMRLFLLLSLNMGATQTDIATLEHGMIDWSTGIVTRPRHKTGQPQQAKLWPQTLALLKQHATDPKASKLVLLGEGGKPLLTETIRDDGGTSKTDSIRLAFERLKARVQLNSHRGFKTFRKTGADCIAKHFPEQPHLVQHYLGHSTKAMVKHYALTHFEGLFQATAKLAEVYGIADLDKAEGKTSKATDVEAIAKAHREADEKLGRDWVKEGCHCAACKAVKGKTSKGK